MEINEESGKNEERGKGEALAGCLVRAREEPAVTGTPTLFNTMTPHLCADDSCLAAGSGAGLDAPRVHLDRHGARVTSAILQDRP